MFKSISVGLLVVIIGCSKSNTAEDVYTVSFETFGGSNIEDQTIVKGSLATKPKDPTKEGYTFTGSWYDSDSSSLVFTETTIPTPYDFSSEVSSNIKLYAGFLISNLPVSIDNNGGEGSLPSFQTTDAPLVNLSEGEYSYLIYDPDLSGLNTLGTKLVQHIGALSSSTKGSLPFQGLSFNKNASSEEDIFIRLNNKGEPEILPAILASEGLENAIKSALLQMSIKGNVSITLAGLTPEAKFYASYY